MSAEASHRETPLPSGSACPPPSGGQSRAALRIWFALFLLLSAAFCCTASGRITYPDDEISFRTAEALYERGRLDIEGMDRRTGERPGRPDGTFGVAPGLNGKTYGFFGYALPLLTAPAVGLGDWLYARVPSWHHAVRTDLLDYYARAPRADMRRMAVVLTNAPILALAAVAFGLWLTTLGLALRTAVMASLALGLSTFAWSYASTYLSEPLSMLVLCTAAWQVRCFHVERARGERGRLALCVAALCTGFSVHVHLLNVLAVPWLLLYAGWPSWHAERLREEKASWALALSLGALGLASLGALNAWRFGNPFESGRYDHYAHWTSPLPALAAFTFGPGRSLLLFAPPVALGLAWGRRVWDELPLEARLSLLIVLTRAAFVAARSDWHGGWGVGPRYLLPVVPFAMLPFAFAMDRASPRRWRWGLAFCWCFGLVQLYAAYHSIAEHMFILANQHGRERYYEVSHWSPSATPLAGYWKIDALMRERLSAQGLAAAIGLARFDALSFGALRMGLVMRDWSLFACFAALGGLASLAAFDLARGLRRLPRPSRGATKSPLAPGHES